MLQLKVKKLDQKAKLPTKAHQSDRCFDLYALESVWLYPHNTAIVKTGIAIGLPEGWGAQILGRSGMSAKGFDVFGGVIDQDYIGELGVILHNSTIEAKSIQAGDKIAQFELVKQNDVELIEVENLEKTDRGEKGFGSSGR